MFSSVTYQPANFGDEIVLRSIDWLENFLWKQDTARTHSDKYEIRLQVKEFAPEEINVKTIDRHVVIEAKHDEKKDNRGTISRHFVRKYSLPDDCQINKVESRYSNGLLVISAPRKHTRIQDIVIPVMHENGQRSKL